MFISIFDIFKIGIGPSSSHTMGPMAAAGRFLERLRGLELNSQKPVHVRVTFYGSLAFTGKGHASDRAVILGLAGFTPDTIVSDCIPVIIDEITDKKSIDLDGLPQIIFDPDNDIIFDFGEALKAHPNGMIFSAFDSDSSVILERTYYSIGGGFVLSEEEIAQDTAHKCAEVTFSSFPYAFRNAKEMLEMGDASGLSIAKMKEANELANHSAEELEGRVDKIWSVMNACIERGLDKGGVLPGELNVKRRAANIRAQLDAEKMNNSQSPHICNEWLSLYAMAVNEENAAGGQVVTAPTNGAAGVVPAVLRYYLDFVDSARADKIPVFLLTAAAIGGIIKDNASISGAEVGCQGEVGSASAMAAAGLCAVMGGSNGQIENAAEIALEHHLGMTCDPVGGLVQVPCIERNGLGAVKAVTASALALRGNGEHFIPLDVCIETMRQTGLDMREQYKETSLGGLAVNIIEC